MHSPHTDHGKANGAKTQRLCAEAVGLPVAVCIQSQLSDHRCILVPVQSLAFPAGWQSIQTGLGEQVYVVVEVMETQSGGNGIESPVRFQYRQYAGWEKVQLHVPLGQVIYRLR